MRGSVTPISHTYEKVDRVQAAPSQDTPGFLGLRPSE
jgi:hypothetical protein